MSKSVELTSPLTDKDVMELEIGDRVLISGVLYTARDSAHKRLIDMLAVGQELPVDLKGQILYYVGPSPARPGRVIGAAGPTTASRMDSYTPTLLALGLKACRFSLTRVKIFSRSDAIGISAILLTSP